MTLALTWRGVGAGCADYILNGQSVLAGTPVRVALEQHGPLVGPRPEWVEVALQLESPLKRVFGRSTMMLDRLAFRHSQRSGSHEIATTEPFLVKPPAQPKGSSRLVCTVHRAGTPGAWIDSIASDRGYQVSTEDPRHYSAKGSVSIEAIEGTLELGRQGGSSSTVSRYIVTAVDPHLTVSVLLPGAEDDLRSYVTEYVANIATLLGASSIPARYEFLGVWGAYLGRQVVQDIRVEITPNELILGGGEVEVLTVVASARQASDTPALLAIRLTDVSTGLSTISDLIRIDRREPSATGRVNHQQAQAFSGSSEFRVGEATGGEDHS